MRDAFLTERDAHCVRDAGFTRDARLRRVGGTHRITYHSEAASLITYLQNNLICGIILLDKLEFGGESPLTMRAWCGAFRYCPNPLGIVTAKQLDKLEFSG